MRDSLLAALPIRDIKISVGTQTNSAGIARIIADFEPAASGSFNIINNASAPDSAGELFEECFQGFKSGFEEAMIHTFGSQLPAVQVVVKYILVHEIDSNTRMNSKAGRLAVHELLRLTKSSY